MEPDSGGNHESSRGNSTSKTDALCLVRCESEQIRKRKGPGSDVPFLAEEDQPLLGKKRGIF